MDLLKSVELEQQKEVKPSVKVGDTVRVHVKIKEGNKERIQVFEGTVIKIQGGGVNQTFTVRRISYGVGVEKTFLVNSPLVEKVETVRQGIVRRAKLFYLRDRVGKATKVKEKIFVKEENKKVAPAKVEEAKAEEVKEEVVEAPAVEETAAEENN
ncbi:MAG: 50S ribosomal protein L19 [Clostridiales bacterium]|nr:50S ribosomal protein L19 [Clostridiales bacterium]